jgi:hypothetical protein
MCDAHRFDALGLASYSPDSLGANQRLVLFKRVKAKGRSLNRWRK